MPLIQRARTPVRGARMSGRKRSLFEWFVLLKANAGNNPGVGGGRYEPLGSSQFGEEGTSVAKLCVSRSVCSCTRPCAGK
jgi:hypothetical protein